jgi:uncharacterized RDD family membrane protein YckC
MGHLKINTTQNVQIEYPTANVGLRILSQILDYVFIAVYFFIVIFLLGLMDFDGGAVILLFFIPVFFYSFIMESVFQGQSFGKMIMRIKVVKLDGSQATLLQYFIRWIFRLVDVHPFYGIVAIISIAAGSKGQRLGDRAAGTTVVSLEKTFNFRYSVYRAINEDYQLKFPQVEQLADADISTVNEVLNHHTKNPGYQSAQLLEKTKLAILKKTGIETDMEAHPFLRVVVKDYNYMARNETY